MRPASRQTAAGERRRLSPPPPLPHAAASCRCYSCVALQPTERSTAASPLAGIAAAHCTLSTSARAAVRMSKKNNLQTRQRMHAARLESACRCCFAVNRLNASMAED